MTGTEYQKCAMRTANHLDSDKLLLNGVLGLNGESGEVSDHLKKHLFQGHDLDKTDRHAEICSELNELYRRKNADYGDSFGKSWDEEGYHAFTVRGGDKMNRIKQLFKNEAQVSDESIIDSLRDLANYCIMTVMELEDRK